MSPNPPSAASCNDVSRRTPVILLAEDEPDCASLVRDSIRDPAVPHELHVVQTGEEAIAYLSGDGRFADRAAFPFPFLLLLDLKMPGMGGFGVLRWLMMHPEIKGDLKVVVVSSMESPKEFEVVYELGGQFFWPKSEGSALGDRVRHLKDAWLRAD